MVQTRSASSSVTPRVSPPPTSSTPRAPRTKSSRATARGALSHAPSTATLAWLAVSLPLVVWDTGYVLLRPHSMPGGWLHKPIWAPYELYGRVDHIYGWPAWRANNGFTAAQGSMNAIETALYLWYLYIWSSSSSSSATAAGTASGRRRVEGRDAAVALLVMFSALVMTLSKTVLYWLNEYWSGFHNVGHNSWTQLTFLWICPNGAWLVVPTYLLYVYGAEIMDALVGPSDHAVAKEE